MPVLRAGDLVKQGSAQSRAALHSDGKDCFSKNTSSEVLVSCLSDQVSIMTDILVDINTRDKNSRCYKQYDVTNMTLVEKNVDNIVNGNDGTNFKNLIKYVTSNREAYDSVKGVLERAKT